MPNPLLRLLDPPRASLGHKISKLGPLDPKLGPPVIFEIMHVGIFCLLTKLFTHVRKQLLLSGKKKFCIVKFFRGTPEAKNTINSSLRSKNF